MREKRRSIRQNGNGGDFSGTSEGEKENCRQKRNVFKKDFSILSSENHGQEYDSAKAKDPFSSENGSCKIHKKTFFGGTESKARIIFQ